MIKLKNLRKVIESKSYDNTTVVKDFELNSISTSVSGDATFIITDDISDREQDVVYPDGLDITNFLRNPVVLWGHNADELPVGKCVNIERQNNGWIATVEFVPSDYPHIGDKAEAIRRSIKDGFLNAVSIGFIPKDWEFNENGGLNITASELTEFSIVSVPCNPNALAVERTLTTEEPVIEEEELNKETTINEKDKSKKLRIKRIKMDLDYFGIK